MTSLAILAVALKSLPQKTFKNIRSVFVTVDPQRDDAAITQK
ncbi:SCO family protein [Candidatus Enterovibrio altilux]|uniref:Uncharacterized protein n=1 Tax=Candidatus Enterovibrio altilux TaxID=1927128 RepID=A0A291BAM8_9GAMM|nr:SCO family protein [Candidatus Enterovibrio luxaltus]ATF10047.1 hypothetical protein BTN50_1605 [Candidatus Enterovibrio luxaltus]